jgi:hypothetical protein
VHAAQANSLTAALWRQEAGGPAALALELWWRWERAREVRQGQRKVKAQLNRVEEAKERESTGGGEELCHSAMAGTRERETERGREREGEERVSDREKAEGVGFPHRAS